MNNDKQEISKPRGEHSKGWVVLFVSATRAIIKYYFTNEHFAYAEYTKLREAFGERRVELMKVDNLNLELNIGELLKSEFEYLTANGEGSRELELNELRHKLIDLDINTEGDE